MGWVCSIYHKFNAFNTGVWQMNTQTQEALKEKNHED
jgi:hypothetical protein